MHKAIGRHLPGRILLLCAGLAVMAYGVAFSIKAALGTSPISSLPYVTGVISGLSVGTTTIIINCVFVLIQMLILRRRFQWFQLLQIPGVIFFGLLIDLGGYTLQGIPCQAYWQQWILCMIGILVLAFGVSMEIAAKLITTPGEGIVLAVCQVSSIKFGNMKVIFDVSLVVVAALVSLLFLHRLDGVREGTVAAAIFVGLLTKVFHRPLGRFAQKHLQ